MNILYALIAFGFFWIFSVIAIVYLAKKHPRTVDDSDLKTHRPNNFALSGSAVSGSRAAYESSLRRR